MGGLPLPIRAATVGSRYRSEVLTVSIASRLRLTLLIGRLAITIAFPGAVAAE